MWHSKVNIFDLKIKVKQRFLKNEKKKRIIQFVKKLFDKNTT